MSNTYNDHLSSLINSVTQKLVVDEASAVLIKHYNSFDLTKDIVENVFSSKKGIKYVYHKFDGSVMADAYEPFLSFIKKVFYKEYNMTIDEFLDECGVYELHKSVIRSYFETGICKRDDEVLYSEYQYEYQMMRENIDNMLKYISSNEKIVFVFNGLNDANESTLKILLGMIDNDKYNNISIIATYNEMSNIPDYVMDLWKEYLDYLVSNDSVIEWSFGENKSVNDLKHDFNFSIEKLPDYIEKLKNMYHMISICQAEYYLNLIYKKIEFEKLDIPERQVFDFMELYTQVALMLDKNSEAMIYAEVMKNISDNNICDKEFRYKYILAQIHMFSGRNDEAQKAALDCYKIAQKKGDEFAMFRADLAHFVSGYSGWKMKAFLDQYSKASNSLLENAEKYGYYNQLAHICVLAFDNKGEQFRDIAKLEENLQYFYKGINIAKKLGNERLIVEGYKKNVMVASTNGFFDISNYYYELLTEVDLIKNNDFEIAHIYNGLGYNNCTAENFEKANEYYNKALISFNKIEDTLFVGETLYNMAINAMLANEYKVASEYLEICLYIIKALKSDSLRICNFSKLAGLLTLCYYRLGATYRCKLTLQASLQYLDHLYVADLKDKKNDEFYHLWGDDLFLCHYNNALVLMNEERYEESLKEFTNAQKYMEESIGFQFFSATQFCIDKATLYIRMGEKDKAENILEKCKQFCENKGYTFKAKMIEKYRNKTETNSQVCSLPLQGITLSQIESNVKSLAVQYSYVRQRHNMEFLSVWQKSVEGYADTSEKIIVTSFEIFKKYFCADYVVFIRNENGVPVVKYDDSFTGIHKDRVDYVVKYFETNRTEVITSRTEMNYYEHRVLINNVLCSDRINSVIFVPIYNNEKLDSIFITYSLLKDSWNSLSSKLVCEKDELPIFMFFYRELLATIDRLEDKMEIVKINNKLQDANVSLSQLAERAEAANRAKTDFLAKMSHEIRTPINAVIGMNEMILRESTEPEIHKYAFDVKSSANTLLSLINEILDSAKIESGKLEIIPVTYDISSLFHDVYNMINLRAQKKCLKLVFDIDKDMPSGLYGDDIRIRQIVVNLLTNAVKYTHEGTVTLIAKSQIKGDKAVLSIKVIDTGIGIKEEDIDKLFGKFERIEESRNRNIEGTGLGMNITQQLLRLMGSELEVKSEYGKGSEFSFYIEQGITNVEPLGDFNERINQKASEYKYSLSYVAPDAKLLVVDDNDINRKVVRSLLKKSQIKVSEADSGMACIKKLEEEKFDIILLDYMMPIMDGVETLNQIRNQHMCDNVPILMLTANAVVGAKEQFLSAGFDDYLTKPIEPEKLDKAILEYLPKELIIEGELVEEIKEDTDLPALDEFDFNYAMNILKDKEILVNTLQDVKRMLGALPAKLNDLFMNIENREALNLYKIEVHALKSSAAMVGAMLLSKLARLLEVAAIDKEIDKIITLHPILLEEMSKHRERLLEAYPEVKEKMQIEDEELIFGYFDMLEMAVSNDDYDTADFVCDEIQKYSYPESVCKQVDELIEQVNKLNANAAVELINIIKGNW